MISSMSASSSSLKLFDAMDHLLSVFLATGCFTGSASTMPPGNSTSVCEEPPAVFSERPINPLLALAGGVAPGGPMVYEPPTWTSSEAVELPLPTVGCWYRWLSKRLRVSASFAASSSCCRGSGWIVGSSSAKGCSAPVGAALTVLLPVPLAGLAAGAGTIDAMDASPSELPWAANSAAIASSMLASPSSDTMTSSLCMALR
mmetsp:Transcript_98896/g.262653  ORF Transcript_98896/g.262653 Transcript_98896/m.262653 type:complete len:202 (-) Transcript_98896:215-820(-)